MLLLKELKKEIVAGSAIQTFHFFIQWHLTERCNLSCRHCYQKKRTAREMTPEEIKAQIDGAMDMFQAWEEEQGMTLSPSIHFTGGEPFLYGKLWDVVAHARELGCQTAILSNGSLIDRSDAHQAKLLGVSEIQISLEGPRDIHETIRGKGSFDAALRGARILAENGQNVTANVTLSRLNADRIEETVETAKAAGFGSIGFSRLVPCGSGQDLLTHMLSPQQTRKAFHQALDLNSPAFEVSSGDPLATILAGVKPAAGCSLALSGCSAGFSGVTITSDGTVMPCRRIGLPAGHLRKASLRQIWATSRLLWRLRNRNSYQGNCGHCELWPVCRGCRAVAYACSAAQGKADLFADDPQCWLINQGENPPSWKSSSSS